MRRRSTVNQRASLPWHPFFQVVAPRPSPGYHISSSRAAARSAGSTFTREMFSVSHCLNRGSLTSAPIALAVARLPSASYSAADCQRLHPVQESN